ncbi:MAG: STAS domain-containing protein [Coriobacteriia bacterium]|nr:STAS domain-containing protein [Coriobacteriia bacterium]
MPAFIEAWRSGALTSDSALRNIAAGIVVGVVALPLAMAFAIASGAAPVQGLYTALVAGLVVTLIGGSRVQIAGPTGAFAVLLFGVTAKYGIAGLQIVTILAGALLVLLGISKLGGMVRYIPESVVLGFTAGIAVVIWVGQWPAFLGLPAVGGVALYEKLPALLGVLPQLDPMTTALGVASLLIVVLWPRIPVLGQVPSPMVALVGATLVVAFVQPDGVATIGSAFGGIPRGLPPLTLPHLTMSTVVDLLQPAVAVAILGAIESLLSATVADGMIGTKHDPNQELIGQGVANVAAGLLGGFAATGAVARTATNVRHGGTTPVAGLAHAAVVLLFLVVLAPLAVYVPLTALSAVLFVVAFNMSQLGRVARMVRRAPRSDAAIMLVTMLLAVFADVSVAVEVGVMLAMLNFFRRMTASVQVRELSESDVSARVAVGGDSEAVLPPGVIVYAIDGPFFFGAVEAFENALATTGSDPRALILKFVAVPFVDMTGLIALKDAVDSLEKRGIHVALCGANEDVASRLARAEIAATVDVPVTATLSEAVAAVRAALAT